MIYDVLDYYDRLLQDPTYGANAQIRAIAEAKLIEVPPIVEFQTWDLSSTIPDMRFPTLQQVYDSSPALPVQYANLWTLQHTICWYWWCDEPVDRPARQALAVTLAALKKVLDYSLGKATAVGEIINIEGVQAQVAGWTQGEDKRRFTELLLEFVVTERDTVLQGVSAL